jgi:hypothetical protein
MSFLKTLGESAEEHSRIAWGVRVTMNPTTGNFTIRVLDRRIHGEASNAYVDVHVPPWFMHVARHMIGKGKRADFARLLVLSAHTDHDALEHALDTTFTWYTDNNCWGRRCRYTIGAWRIWLAHDALVRDHLARTRTARTAAP